MAAGVVDAVVQGLDGLTHDVALQVTPPDVELADVVCPVRLWYGTATVGAPVVRSLARRPPPGRHAHVVPGAGPLPRPAAMGRDPARLSAG